jgi:hypothetical protein
MYPNCRQDFASREGVRVAGKLVKQGSPEPRHLPSFSFNRPLPLQFVTIRFGKFDS